MSDGTKPSAAVDAFLHALNEACLSEGSDPRPAMRTILMRHVDFWCLDPAAANKALEIVAVRCRLELLKDEEFQS